MHLAKSFLLTFFLIYVAIANSHAAAANFDQKIQQVLKNHYQKYHELEYFSGASLSVLLPGQAIRDYYVGKVSHEKNSQPISSETLFHIGSITKSFTAAVILQLAKEKKVNLEDKLITWLPQYDKWGRETITSLLNMSSGLPNYSDTPLFNTTVYQQPEKNWLSTDLIEFVYPADKFSPPLKSGYFYTNTGYILNSLIVEKATANSFHHELDKRTIDRAKLKNTFYTTTTMPPDISARLARSYNYNQYDNPRLVGKEVSHINLSWAAAAGGIISDSHDIIEWIRALFIGNDILDQAQKHILMQLISTKTGNPIKQTNEHESHGFGLGVSQIFDKKFGRFWFYEGMTFGFRAIYIYAPCNGIILASIFNSATNSENDHAHLLLMSVYETILKKNPHLQCRS